MERKAIRLILGGVLIITVTVILVAALQARDEVEGWAAIAAALAVIAAVLSAWSAQRVLELQENALRPYPYPSIDVRSRYGLLLLRVTNAGGSSAHQISLIWDKPLSNSKEEAIGFTGIGVLLPKESIAKIIDGSVHFFAKYPGAEANYSGMIVFSDASGRVYREPFKLSAGQYAGTPVHDDESLRTHYDLQKIPAEIAKVSDELRRIRRDSHDEP